MDVVGADAPFLFALLGGALWSRCHAEAASLREAWRRGPRGLAAFFGEALATARALARDRLRIRARPRAVRAVGAAYAGSGRRAPIPAQMAQVIAFALEAAGAPIVKGGAARLLAAFER